jgi:hypothetical protein
VRLLLLAPPGADQAPGSVTAEIEAQLSELSLIRNSR